ncbi:hypothetical protein [Flavobacterium sp.]|uniref:hypothetical protein n=1 Tax=Flavobacterium sp. TaxID=239 RepID=UPI0026201578|nr:hypothetical protein [Flavobacterium sp.]MDD2987275.1 hypothetical protein [Flavobacterium sp.]
MKKIIFINLIITSFLSSCSSGVIVTNLTERNKQDVNNVSLLSNQEISEMNGDFVGDIILKENSKLDWNFLKTKLVETAKNNGANHILINNIGYNLKGYGFYLEGKMYYSEKPTILKYENCEVGFVRDRFESVLGSAFAIEVKVEGQKLGELKKDNSLIYEAKSCDEKLNVQINKKELLVTLNGKSKYYKIGKQTAGGSSGGGIQIGIGGLSVVEIEDEQLGRLLYLQNK